MFQKTLIFSTLIILVFSLRDAVVALEKGDENLITTSSDLDLPGMLANGMNQNSKSNQANFDALPADLKSLIKRTLYADAENSYHISTNETGQLFAINKLQNLEVTFTNEGVQVKGTRPQNLWELSLNLKRFGWIDAIKPVSTGRVTSHMNRVEINRGTVKEWFVNDKRGLEQGFTIDQAPEGTGSWLVFELLINSDWEILVSKDKRNMTLTNKTGQSINYSGLIAKDAQNKALNTWFDSRDSDEGLTCVIVVDAADAQFPIIVDPVINEVQKILPNDGTANDFFGMSVGIASDTVVVGAPDDGPGSAYIFVQTGTTWSQQAKLLASDGALGDSFGSSVGIVDTSIGNIKDRVVVVGAPGDDDNGIGSGSAYIFERIGTTWSEQGKLLPNDGAANDSFGSSVSIARSAAGIDIHAIVGAPGDDDNGFSSGSAYIFSPFLLLPWTQDAKLLPSDGAAGDFFGTSVDIVGRTAIVGAAGDDDNGGVSGSAYIFVRPGSWVQQTKLLPPDGAPGDLFGISVGISGKDKLFNSIIGDTVVVGAPNNDDIGSVSGSAYIFVRTGSVLAGTWSLQTKLLPNDGVAGDLFGRSVSILVDTVIVGASRDDDNGFSSGSGYVFTRNGITWSQQAKLLASDGALGDSFGSSVAVSNEKAIVGADFDDDNGNSSGSVYGFNIFAQKDLGFQLGNLRLSIVGEDLTLSGSTATLCVSGAVPNAPFFFAIGPSNNPTPFLGGFIVPSPATILGPFIADATGNFTLQISGGDNTPFIFFIQAGAANGTSFELSNALEVNIGS